jgi:hypothetical protein
MTVMTADRRKTIEKADARSRLSSLELCRLSSLQRFRLEIETFETFGFRKWSWRVEAIDRRVLLA